MIFLLALSAYCPRAQAAPPTAAVFAFELDDTSLQAETRGLDANDLTRLARLDTQLHTALAASGQYALLSVAAGYNKMTLRTCNGCEPDLARHVNAKVVVFGWVQKVSNLILNINVVFRDVATGHRIKTGSVDIRGDTDESWTRGLSYLLRNRLLVDDDVR